MTEDRIYLKLLSQMFSLARLASILLLRSVSIQIRMVLFLTVRLAGSELPYEGRLEVYYSGSSGTVCDDSFDDIDATVACKSLGSGLVLYVSVVATIILVSVNIGSMYRRIVGNVII